ncbi:MAG: hypothetical protein LIP03_10540 [Bacteroidales bacterium]|nr:hypothetical protein [Bacteroidales bacterium]
MNQQQTPASLAQHQQWQQKYLKLLERIPGYSMVAPKIEDFLRRIIDKGEFYMRVRPDRLAPILESGRIKNVMETGTSATMGGAEVRRKSTEMLFGCKAYDLKDSDYPKFGYLSTADAKIDALMNADMAWHYGDALIRMDKKLMLGRTTLTIGSSLNFGVSDFLTPTLTSQVRATCLPGPKHGIRETEVVHKMGAQYFMMFEAIASGAINEKNFWRISELIGNRSPAFDSFELQFHGPLRLGREVVEVIVPPDVADQSLAPAYQSAGVAFTLAESIW